jgi:hypothetical protein
MFIKETKEINSYTKTSKFGKFTSYTRSKTITHWRCDNCEAEFTKCRNGKYDTDVKSYCRECINKIGGMKLASINGYLAKAEKHATQPKKAVTDKQLYPDVYYGLDYPYREGYGTIREHIYVMECYLKRSLQKGEIVHHIDGDKTNNKIENLFLTTVSEHNKLHGASERILFELVKMGKVRFNRDCARYELVPEEVVKNILESSHVL